MLTPTLPGFVSLLLVLFHLSSFLIFLFSFPVHGMLSLEEKKNGLCSLLE